MLTVRGSCGAIQGASTELATINSMTAVAPSPHRSRQSRCHDAAVIGLPADSNRVAAQQRIVALLDRRVERVHVDVQDAPEATHGNPNGKTC